MPALGSCLLLLAVLPCALVPAVCVADDWEFVLKWGSLGTDDGQFDTPSGIAVDYSGVVYVADSGNHRIQMFDGETGAFLDKWGAFGSGNGKFDQPRAVCCSWSSHVYVADTGNDRIQKFTSDGSYVLQWGSHGTGPGEFEEPSGVACDWSGDVYVADTGNHRIQKFSNSGKFLVQWGREGSGSGQLNSPRSLAFLMGFNGSYEAIAAADEMNDRVQVFRLDGTLAGILDAGLSRPQGVCAVDEPGGCLPWMSVCIADTGHHRIKHQEGGSWGVYGVGDGQFHSPGDAASLYTYLGRLVWVADTGNHRVQLFDFPCVVAPSSWTAIKARYR